MEHIYGTELLESFKKGKKEFSDISLQFCELEGIDISGLVIKNSKLDYVSFRNSILKEAKFVNCEMFFVSFFGSDVENAIFDKCKIDIVRFDNMFTKNTKIINCSLSYAILVGTNLGELNIFGTSEFKVVRNIAEIGEDDVRNIMIRLGAQLENLPFEIKLRLKSTVERVLNEFNQDTKLAQSDGKAYKTPNSSYNQSNNIYKALNAISEEFAKYGKSEIYKTKKPYK